jgi:hypothetical protein
VEPTTDRLLMAVRLVARSSAPQRAARGDLDLSEAFLAAYESVTRLTPDATDWTLELADAAWDLARAAMPQGAPLPDLIAALERSHQAVAPAPNAPSGRSRTRPRRDA